MGLVGERLTAEVYSLIPVTMRRYTNRTGIRVRLELPERAPSDKFDSTVETADNRRDSRRAREGA